MLSEAELFDYRYSRHCCDFSKGCPNLSKLLTYLYSSLLIKFHDIKHHVQLLSENGNIWWKNWKIFQNQEKYSPKGNWKFYFDSAERFIYEVLSRHNSQTIWELNNSFELGPAAIEGN